MTNIKNIIAAHITENLKFEAAEMSLEDWAVKVESDMQTGDYRADMAFMEELKAAAGVRHMDELLDITRAAMTELHADYQASGEEMTIEEMGVNLGRALKANAAKKIAALATECANECWDAHNADQKAALARDTARGCFERTTSELPMSGDFDYLEEKAGEVEEESEELFSDAYLATLEEIAAAHYETTVKAEDAEMQASALAGDAGAVDYCYISQI